MRYRVSDDVALATDSDIQHMFKNAVSGFFLLFRIPHSPTLALSPPSSSLSPSIPLLPIPSFPLTRFPQPQHRPQSLSARPSLLLPQLPSFPPATNQPCPLQLDSWCTSHITPTFHWTPSSGRPSALFRCLLRCGRRRFKRPRCFLGCWCLN